MNEKREGGKEEGREEGREGGVSHECRRVRERTERKGGLVGGREGGEDESYYVRLDRNACLANRWEKKKSESEERKKREVVWKRGREGGKEGWGCRSRNS